MASCHCFVLFSFFWLLSGTRSLVTVHQPPVVTTALGHDVIMPCQLQVPPGEKMTTLPVLYWVYEPHANNLKVWPASARYVGRVDLLEKNSSDKSILLKNTQWADSGKHLCKLSITTVKDQSYRSKGNETLLMVYGKYEFFSWCHC